MQLGWETRDGEGKGDVGMRAQAGQAGPATHLVILQVTPRWPWLSPV